MTCSCSQPFAQCSFPPPCFRRCEISDDEEELLWDTDNCLRCPPGPTQGDLGIPYPFRFQKLCTNLNHAPSSFFLSHLLIYMLRNSSLNLNCCRFSCQIRGGEYLATQRNVDRAAVQAQTLLRRSRHGRGFCPCFRTR
jgi:hypothetical protein